MLPVSGSTLRKVLGARSIGPSIAGPLGLHMPQIDNMLTE